MSYWNDWIREASTSAAHVAWCSQRLLAAPRLSLQPSCWRRFSERRPPLDGPQCFVPSIFFAAWVSCRGYTKTPPEGAATHIWRATNIITTISSATDAEG